MALHDNVTFAEEHMRLWVSVVATVAWGTCALGGSNLVFNGSFDCPTNPLAGWMYDYTWLGNQFYNDNHTRVSWVKEDSGRKGVVKFSAGADVLENQGVWLDSKPFPYEFGAKYRLTVWARSEGRNGTGPNCRIYFVGYKWKSGIKPHPDPDLTEMAPNPPGCIIKQGAGYIVYFGSKGRDFSDPKRSWTKGQTTFPREDPSDEEIKRLKMCDFLTVHICVLGGSAGDLYVDDVVVEKIADKMSFVDKLKQRSPTR